MIKHSYLGDGVYASFDGYQIWLAANSHENLVIALEPAVMEALFQYAKQVMQIRTNNTNDEVEE